MKKILIEGKNKDQKIFNCSNCGCRFSADKGEYQEEREPHVKNTWLVTFKINCPFCLGEVKRIGLFFYDNGHEIEIQYDGGSCMD